MLDKAPKSDSLRVEFYSRRPEGISKGFPITDKSQYLTTSFRTKEMIINPKNKEDISIKTLSMLFWMMMEPNMFAVIKLPSGDNFLYMDIYSLYDYGYVSGGIDGGLDSVSNYKEYDDKFTEIFAYGDIRHFLGFNNHELSKSYDNIIDYIMNKVLQHYITFLGGNDKAKIFDLR